MKNLFKILLLNLLFIHFNIEVLSAQTSFVSNKVKEVFSLLPQQAKEQVQSGVPQKKGVIFYKININGQLLETDVRYNEFKEIEHIGLLVFKDDKSFADIREVLDYIERSFLISALKKEGYFLENEVKIDDIKVEFNGLAINSQNNPNVLTEISKGNISKLNLKFNSDAFMIEWKFNQNNTFSIKIPNNYSVITGQTKDELEKNLLRKIKNSKNVNVEKTTPVKSQLKLVNGNLYCLPGQIYSTTPELSSTKYFQVTAAIVPVFDKIHYRESIRNLFLNLLSTSVKLNLEQKMYGGTNEKFTANINNLYANFTDDYNIYFGWQNDNKQNLKASVFFSHKIYNYNHLLIITPEYKTIFKKDGEVEGIFMTFIPREKQLVAN